MKNRRSMSFAPIALLLALEGPAAAQEVPPAPDPIQVCEQGCSDAEANCRAVCMPLDGSASLESDVQEAIEECAAACVTPTLACFEACAVLSGSVPQQ